MSRILSMLKGLAFAFAATEVAAATPYAQKALGELSDDLKSADPVAAFVNTAKNAYDAMKADEAFTSGLSLTGLLGATAHALVG